MAGSFVGLRAWHTGMVRTHSSSSPVTASKGVRFSYHLAFWALQHHIASHLGKRACGWAGGFSGSNEGRALSRLRSTSRALNVAPRNGIRPSSKSFVVRRTLDVVMMMPVVRG